MDAGKQEVSIRLLTAEDASAYRTVRLESLQKYPDHFCSDYAEQSVLPELYLEGCLKDPQSPHFVVGAFYSEVLVGICGFSRSTGGRTRYLGEVIQMYVRQDFQGMGIGRKLIHAVIRQAFSNPGIEKIQLSVSVANPSAIGLYQSVGFVPTGILPAQFLGSAGYVDLQYMLLSR